MRCYQCAKRNVLLSNKSRGVCANPENDLAEIASQLNLIGKGAVIWLPFQSYKSSFMRLFWPGNTKKIGVWYNSNHIKLWNEIISIYAPTFGNNPGFFQITFIYSTCFYLSNFHLLFLNDWEEP